MSHFKKYLHVERLSKEEVEGITNGTCYIFPKLDGSNCCIWQENDGAHFGSRNREIALTKDNAGFMNYFVNGKTEDAAMMLEVVKDNPDYIFYGEWLGTKNHIKSYEQIRFWVFAIYDRAGEEFLHYDEQVAVLADYPYLIEPLAVVENPSETELRGLAEGNHFNLPSDVIGEGVVIKNYSYRNKWGEVAVAKIVRDEYTESKSKKKVFDGSVEEEIAETYMTAAFMSKTLCKVKAIAEVDKWDVDKKLMGMFIGLCFKELVEEEIYGITKKMKCPTINFSDLKCLVTDKARNYALNYREEIV